MYLFEEKKNIANSYLENDKPKLVLTAKKEKMELYLIFGSISHIKYMQYLLIYGAVT